MDILGLLVNGVGGGALGSVLHCFTSYFDTKNKIALMNAQVAAAEKTEAWKAFSESQVGANTPMKVPENVHPWISGFYVIVDAIRQLTRPLLTWAAIAIICMVYFRATPSVRDTMSGEIVFGCFTAVFWWFGSRYSKSK